LLNAEVTVQERQANSENTAILIGTSVDSLPTPIAEALQNGIDTIVPCADVFTGLVRIGRTSARLVIVDVERLGQAELDFFRLMRRRRRGLPVLVHASRVACPNVDRAVRVGATGPLTAEALAGIAIRPGARRPIDGPHASATADVRGSDENLAGSFASAGNVLDAEHRARLLSDAMRRHDEGREAAPLPEANPQKEARPDEAPERSETEGEFTEELGDFADEGADDEDDGAPPGETEPNAEADRNTREARVPWLRYHDTPKRIGPAPRRSPHSPGRRAMADEPLLTPEELDALLGDDPLAEEE
jgi:hypothetical protein